MTRPTSKASFGRDVMGPVFADFALRLWIFLSNMEMPSEAIVLFCARGGFRLRLIYEHFLAASGLESPVATDDLMVSRVVAVRAALLAGAPSAFEQIGFELAGSSMRDAVSAISGSDPVSDQDDTEMWDAPYSSERLKALLSSTQGAAVRANLATQAGLFREHLTTCSAGRKRIILCDTGLFGSTMQLLEQGFPELAWSCAMFARAKSKPFSAPHFKRTFGLCVQADRYSPFDASTAVLRYWHLIESTLEPQLPSVCTFERVDGIVHSNLEIDSWQKKVAPGRDEIFAGILDYIDSLPRVGTAARIMADVRAAHAELRRAVVWPTRSDVALLDAGSRSVDFGRLENVTVIRDRAGLVGALRKSLWREGAVVLAASWLRRPLLMGVEAAYAARWALHLVNGVR
jgi:hypothetical protein